MEITKSTLPGLLERDGYVRFVSSFAIDTLSHARLFPRLNFHRLIEAHGAWKNDLTRVGENEPKLEDGLDHFKQAGHLAFWFRRMSPVVEANDLTQNLGDSEGPPLIEDERKFRDLLFGYLNEYLAFDIGFQICKYYESAKVDPNPRAHVLVLTEDFYRTTCHFMKYKNVSPHALFLIYKSLFAI